MKHAARYGVTSGAGPARRRPLDLDGLGRDSAGRGELTVRVNYRPSLDGMAEGARQARSRSAERRVAPDRRRQGLRGRLARRRARRRDLRAVSTTSPATRRLRRRGDPALEDGGARRRRPTRRGPAGRGPRDRRPGQRARSSTSSSGSRSRTARRDRRFRIEHAQHLRPGDIPRFAALGVIASMQPYHADRRRALGGQTHRPGAGAGRPTRSGRSSTRRPRLAFGSDWDVAPLSPLAGIAAAVTRRDDRRKEPGRLGPRAEDLGGGGAAGLHRRRRPGRAFEEKGEGEPRAREARRLRRSRGRSPLRSNPDGSRRSQVDTDGRRRQNRVLDSLPSTRQRQGAEVACASQAASD